MNKLFSAVIVAGLTTGVVSLVGSDRAAQADAFTTGSLRGVVKDAQGVIPGVTVTMVNEGNGVQRDTVTNEVKLVALWSRPRTSMRSAGPAACWRS